MASDRESRPSSEFRVFIRSGVTSDMSEGLIKENFMKFGEVLDVYIPKEYRSSKPRGFGYVTFKDEESLQKALVGPTQEIKGKTIGVERAAPKERRSSSSRSSSTGVANEDARIFVGGIPDEMEEDALRAHFDRYGKVVDMFFPRDKSDPSKRRGFGYVTFETMRQAEAAAARSPRTIAGQDIGEIKVADPRPGYERGSGYGHARASDRGYGHSAGSDVSRYLSPDLGIDARYDRLSAVGGAGVGGLSGLTALGLASLRGAANPLAARGGLPTGLVGGGVEIGTPVFLGSYGSYVPGLSDLQGSAAGGLGVTSNGRTGITDSSLALGAAALGAYSGSSVFSTIGATAYPSVGAPVTGNTGSYPLTQANFSASEQAGAGAVDYSSSYRISRNSPGTSRNLRYAPY